MRSTPALTTLAGAAALLALCFTAPAEAQAADAVFSDFQPSGEFQVELDGQVLESAEVYRAEKASSYLIMAPEISSPLLVNARTRSVESVSLLKVAKRDDGTIDLLADASFNTVGPFAVGGKQLSFTYKGQKVVLASKPPLTGLQPATALVEHNPAYGFKAKQYEPDETQLKALRSLEKDVRVRVYFGNWCPVCGRLVPKVLRIAEALEGSKIEFEYYGLPQPMFDDPITAKEEIHGVPTAVVYVGETEKGRLGGRDLFKPEASLSQMLAGS